MAQSDTETDAAAAKDGAAENLLPQEEKARAVSLEMPDAKYNVGDQRNGDANCKVDVGTNARTFSGLTKEQLLKYQDDPFWVRLRWVMFALFWLLWIAMLVGAILIIVNSPKCAPPPKWYESSPLLDMSGAPSFEDVDGKLAQVQEARIKAVVVSSALAGDIYDEGLDLSAFKELAAAARERGVRIVVDMTANYVNKSHRWFVSSERQEDNYTDYFTWAPGKAAGPEPNNWRSTGNVSAWSWSATRNAYYLHQFDEQHPDLNFRNPRVVQHFADVILEWLAAGAAGIRLLKARQLLVDPELRDEHPLAVPQGTFSDYAYYSHRYTSDHSELAPLLKQWRQLALARDPEFLLSVEEGVLVKAPFFTSSQDTSWSPVLELPATGPVPASEDTKRLHTHINRLLPYWPAVQLTGSDEAAREAAAMSLLLPATPVLTWDQVFVSGDNGTWKVNDKFVQLMSLRMQPEVLNGKYSVTTAVGDKLLACVRWVTADAGLLALYNPGAAAVVGDVGDLQWVPDTLVPHPGANYTIKSNNVTAPPATTTVFKFVPVIDK